MSGGRATVAHKKNDETHQSGGDLTGTDEVGFWLTSRFSIECKFYKEFSLDAWVYDRKQGIPEFWNQCRRDAKRAKKAPMLIAKKNQYPELLVFDSYGKGLLFQNAEGIDLIEYGLVGVFPKYDAYVFSLDKFLKNTRMGM